MEEEKKEEYKGGRGGGGIYKGRNIQRKKHTATYLVVLTRLFVVTTGTTLSNLQVRKQEGGLQRITKVFQTATYL